MITASTANTELYAFGERHGLTQKKLSDKTGISVQTIVAIEKGSVPRASTVYSLNEYIKTFPDEK